MKSISADSISAYEAKTHFSELLHEVEEGRAFVISRHGKPVARLSPIPGRTGSQQDMQVLIEAFRGLRAKVGAPMDLRAMVEEGRKY